MNFGTTEIIFLLFVGTICLGIIVVGTLVSKLVVNRQSNLKKCPFCAEAIQREAVVCRYGGRDLS